MKKNPIIILGMHRSGTTLLANVFEDLGIFMGKKKEQNSEPIFFLRINNWLLRQANAFWDNPYNYTFLDEKEREILVEITKKYLKSLRRLEYFGYEKGLKSFFDLDFFWGWKDPRNSFTLDVWYKIFPNAKLVHIYRNPVDVANSLRTREIKRRKRFKLNWKKEVDILYRNKNLGYGNSVRVLNLAEGVKLWKEYTERIFYLEQKYHLNILHIKYEDFLERPLEILNKILPELDIDIEDSKLKEIIKNINPDRKYAFIKNEELVELYNKIKDDELLSKLGYDKIL